MMPHFCILSSILLFGFTILQPTLSLQTFSQSCESNSNSTEKGLSCDADKGLICTTRKICECKKFANADGIEDIPTVWGHGECLVRANGTCSFKKNGAIRDYHCLRHGICVNNLCVCKAKYVPIHDGTVCNKGNSAAGTAMSLVTILISFVIASNVI